MASALTVRRHFTQKGDDVFEQVTWVDRSVTGVSFKVEAPQFWSDTAVEIAATRYFRRGEKSVRQLIHRVVRAIRLAGEWQGFFQGEAAEAFADELTFLLVHQYGSFNSPVYFNVGLFTEYGVLGSAENFVFDGKAEKAIPQTGAYLHPQASACFIQSVKDDLLSIYDLLKSEAKLFKYGSGTGTNFSGLRGRGEPLENGGHSTGLISYLEIYDKSAQAIKSGGTTRRAAKMVVVDADHPEVLDFVRWKMMEERKARVLLANGFSGGMEGEAFRTVSGQNSNNSVRLSDGFMAGVENGAVWPLKARVDGRIVATLNAKDLWGEIARAAWECADPGVQFHDTIQRWHVCPKSGPIRASNPCSEYMFLDDSACNLSSLNLVKFFDDPGLNELDFRQAVRFFLLAQEILVDYSSYPTAKIAENSHRFRPLGLGYANLGGLLMRRAIPYESREAEKLTGKLTALMHLLALEMSAEMAAAFGAFKGWEENRDPALKVMDAHLKAARELDPSLKTLADKVEGLVERHGLRNAQVTLIAPTGTIGLFMDCDTLGIEPDYSLLKIKTLSGGGEIRLRNQSLRQGLERLGYTAAQSAQIEAYVVEKGTPLGAPGFREEHASVFDCAVPPKGFADRRVSAVGHLKIMAAAQPFLSGAISKTVNLPHSVAVDEVSALYFEAWRRGLKSIAIYRDGSKSLQPLCAEC